MNASELYNVYVVKFAQRRAADHEALALVPAEFDKQDRGRLYHVIGDVGIGMEYECRPGYAFGSSKTYKSQDFKFQIKKSSRDEWEEITSEVEPPHDPRAMNESNPDPPTPDCTTWIAEVLNRAERLAV